jgi:hypothetical protein
MFVFVLTSLGQGSLPFLLLRRKDGVRRFLKAEMDNVLKRGLFVFSRAPDQASQFMLLLGTFFLHGRDLVLGIVLPSSVGDGGDTVLAEAIL